MDFPWNFIEILTEVVKVFEGVKKMGAALDEWKVELARYAVRAGQVEIFRWTHQNLDGWVSFWHFWHFDVNLTGDSVLNLESLAMTAAEELHLECLKEIVSLGCRQDLQKWYDGARNRTHAKHETNPDFHSAYGEENGFGVWRLNRMLSYIKQLASFQNFAIKEWYTFLYIPYLSLYRFVLNRHDLLKKACQRLMDSHIHDSNLCCKNKFREMWPTICWRLERIWIICLQSSPLHCSISKHADKVGVVS